MKAVCWEGIGRMKVESVPDPEILNPGDAIVKITSSCICGSDLHLYDGYVPSVLPGDILGHEFMGEVVEVGPKVSKLKVGDRIAVPFTISCGRCHHCQNDQWAACDNSNPHSWMTDMVYGHTTGGFFGYAHAFGGYAGGQAEYARVPFADFTHMKIENGLVDEQVVFLTDIFPTGYTAAEFCQIKPTDIVAVWGCGPVGQFAIRSAYLLGAHRVIAIDRFPERLAMAREGGAETINYEEANVLEALKEMTGGRGPDACIDAVGMEGHAEGIHFLYDRVKHAARIETDRPYALREAILACRKGGIVSIPGVYGGFIDKVPMGAAFNKGLTFKMGQTHVQKYMKPLMKLIEQGKIDPSFVITHEAPLDQAPELYRTFRDKKDGCIKVVLKPDGNGHRLH